jgi:hypothetical protein
LQIPNAERAVIDPAKLRDYLLSSTHPVGRFKAPLFLGLGYTAADWSRLETDLRGQHLPEDALAAPPTPYGQKYVIRATLIGPTGRSARVVTVWVVRVGEDFARFVTAYPEADA